MRFERGLAIGGFVFYFCVCKEIILGFLGFIRGTFVSFFAPGLKFFTECDINKNYFLKLERNYFPKSTNTTPEDQ